MQTYEGIWFKRQLLPCWILQFLGAGILGVVAALALSAAAYVLANKNKISSTYSYYGYTAEALGTYVVGYCSGVLALVAFTYIANIIEIVLYAKKKLSPVLLLSFACIKTFFWLAYFVLVIIASVSQRKVGILDVIIGIELLATSITQLVFGARYTHQKRKGLLNRGKYSQAAGGGGAEVGFLASNYHQPMNVPNPVGYESYRSPSPAHSHEINAANASYYNQGLEMQPPRAGHY